VISDASKKFLQREPWSAAPCDIPQNIKASHTLFRVVPDDGKSLFTGYFEPVLKGSKQRQGPYQFPIYKPPADLAKAPNYEGSKQPGLHAYGRDAGGKITPHFSRGEIEAGALANQNLELLFVDDEIALFFLHVQGSGKIELDDGSEIRVRFSAKNGHAYTPIGHVLRMEENLAPITMQTITAFLQTHPEKRASILHRNASYIFFELLEGDGPIGAGGEVLKPEQSLAIDDTLWPYGMDVIVETFDPLQPSKPLVLRMKTADTGSAIRGPARGDIFFGQGTAAGIKAGAMNAPGTLWIILPGAT
jgi:membrane-bound lytic murein transglycosylase A